MTEISYDNMPYKTPISIAIITYGWVIIISLWGGLASYMRKIKRGRVAKFSVIELIGDLVISGFSGLMTFYLCQSAEINILITAFLIGISGHMGSRIICLMEDVFDKQIHALIARLSFKTNESLMELNNERISVAIDEISISDIQSSLNRNNPELELIENGDMDEATLTAIKQFQQQNGIRGDGLMGPQTLGVLGLLDRRII